MSPILLDTHVALWSALGKLKPVAARAIAAASARSALLLSPISAWEIGLLAAKGRIELSVGVEETVRRMFASPGIVTAQFSPPIAVAAASMKDMHADPADRILVATAAAYGAALMTRDEVIHAYAKATKHIRCITC